jgi:hypothetical protein
MMAVAGVYHERQELLRCGIHALNNVLQGASALTRPRCCPSLRG